MWRTLPTSTPLYLTGASTLSPAQAAPAGPLPHIVFESVTINAGDVVHGQDALATFTYKNTYGEKLAEFANSESSLTNVM